MNLNKLKQSSIMRIREIANLINDAKIVVDVGSDHAQLSIFLVLEKRAKIVYNIEKNTAPFLNTVKNTAQFKDQVINLKSDGFALFDSSIVIDYCTISGMGAKTMIDILCRSQNKINNIIACPNNHEDLIRKFAYDNFYKIKRDFLVLDNELFYSIIWLSKFEGVKPKIKKCDLLCGNRKLKQDDHYQLLFLKNKIAKLSKIDNLKKNNKVKYKELKIYKKELKKWQ